MTTTSYTVKGMTCEHCVRAVTEEVSGISGVDDVKINLGTGTVTVTAPETPSIDAVRAAVHEAGYELVEA